jgi:ArsR family transcriptional regulator
MTDHDLVKALKAIAHPTRFKMVQEVAAAGELTCGQLGERFHLAQPTISHHLKLLSESGVLLMRREAQHGIISVNREVVQGLLGSLPGRLAPAGARGAVVKARKAARK